MAARDGNRTRLERGDALHTRFEVEAGHQPRNPRRGSMLARDQGREFGAPTCNAESGSQIGWLRVMLGACPTFPWVTLLESSKCRRDGCAIGRKPSCFRRVEADSYEPVIGSDVELEIEGAVDDAEGDESDEGYAFRDLVVLRAIVSLVDKGIPLQRIRSNLETLRDRLPELDDPAAALASVGREHQRSSSCVTTGGSRKLGGS